MVLGRLPKKFKHFIKIITSQLMIYENIQTTNAKVTIHNYLRLNISELMQINL